jgi:hypothetical protein
MICLTLTGNDDATGVQIVPDGRMLARVRRIARILGSFFTPVFVKPQLSSAQPPATPSRNTHGICPSALNGNKGAEKATPMITGGGGNLQMQRCVLVCHPNARDTDRGLALALSKDVVKEAVAIAHEARTKKAHAKCHQE